MGRKKIVGASGKFGARYGKKQKAKFSEIERIQKKKHICPRCKMKYVERESAGIWLCQKCGYKFAGLSYFPSMDVVKE
ncbi:MAG TPA: 50S ribosomal protein L37ae [archaeon]|nr:50S ribosomal protein L37ae [archaeon]